MWPDNIGGTVRKDIGEKVWDKAKEEVMQENEWSEIKNKNKNELIIAAILEKLWKNGKKSKVLEQLCNKIIDYANSNK
jgi:hypothetical protein